MRRRVSTRLVGRSTAPGKGDTRVRRSAVSRPVPSSSPLLAARRGSGPTSAHASQPAYLSIYAKRALALALVRAKGHEKERKEGRMDATDERPWRTAAHACARCCCKLLSYRGRGFDQ